MRMSGGGGRGGEENLKHTPTDTGLKPMTLSSQSEPKLSQTLNRLSHPDTPGNHSFLPTLHLCAN